MTRTHDLRRVAHVITETREAYDEFAIPAFLRRTETPEHAAMLHDRYEVRHTGGEGLTVIVPGTH